MISFLKFTASLSIQPVGDPALSDNRDATVSPADTYVAGEIQFSQNINGEIIAVSPTLGISRIVDALQSDVLSALKTCAGLEELAKRLKKSGWEETDSEVISDLVENLKKCGLVLTLDQFVQNTQKSENEIVQNLQYFCWPTKNRPLELARSLSAWREVFQNTKSMPSFIVADDSDSLRTQVRQKIDEFHKIHTGRFYYLPLEAKLLFSELFPVEMRASVNFSLGLTNELKRPAYGANQNFLYLLTDSKPVAFCDDDILPQFRKSPMEGRALKLFSGLDPTRVHPLTKNDHITDLSKEVSAAEYLSSLEFLGKNTRRLSSSFASVGFEESNVREIEQFFEGTSFPAVLCHPYWGDSGMGEAAYILANRMQLDIDIDDEKRYLELISSRMIFRTSGDTIVGGKSFMGGHIVLNPVSLLPPFSPLERNQDSLWGAILDELTPGAKIMTSTISVNHEPLHPAEGDRIKAGQWRPGVNETLRLIIGFLGSSMNPAIDGYAQYGVALLNFFSGTEDKIHLTLAELITQTIRGRQSLLMENLQHFGESPTWWAEDVYAAMEYLDTYLTYDNFWIPTVFREAKKQFFDYCRQFGQLLANWPKINEQAKLISPEFLASYCL